MMHWIDPDCLPETQGTVEGFIMNRHDEIDGVLLGERGKRLCSCASLGEQHRGRCRHSKQRRNHHRQRSR